MDEDYEGQTEVDGEMYTVEADKLDIENDDGQSLISAEDYVRAEKPGATLLQISVFVTQMYWIFTFFARPEGLAQKVIYP